MAIVVLLALTAVAVLSALRPRVSCLPILGLVSLVWLLVNDPVEGAVLLRLSASHGFTVADLAVPAAWALVAGGRWLLRT